VEANFLVDLENGGSHLRGIISGQTPLQNSSDKALDALHASMRH